jgi:hypothetical protein
MPGKKHPLTGKEMVIRIAGELFTGHEKKINQKK